MGGEDAAPPRSVMRTIVVGAGGKSDTSAARTPSEAANTLRSTATARIVDLVSEGPIVGLVNGRKSVFFDGVALDNANGNPNFADVTVESRLGYPDQSVLPDFSDVEAETSVGITVMNGSPVVQTVSDLDADAVRVTIRIPALWQVDAKTGNVVANGTAIRIDVR